MHQALYGLRKAGGVWVRVAGGRRGARTIMMPQRNMSAESHIEGRKRLRKTLDGTCAPWRAVSREDLLPCTK